MNDAAPPLTEVLIAHRGLSLRSPADSDIDDLMAVFDDDFDLRPNKAPLDRGTVREQVLNQRIRGMRFPKSRNDWQIELLVEDDQQNLIGWAWTYPQHNEWQILETSTWVAPPHRGHRHSGTIRQAVLALVFDGLGAELAVSRSQSDNRSNSTSNRLGYQTSSSVPDRNGYMNWFLRAEQWAAVRPAGITIDGHQQFRDWLAQPSLQ